MGGCCPCWERVSHLSEPNQEKLFQPWLIFWGLLEPVKLTMTVTHHNNAYFYCIWSLLIVSSSSSLEGNIWNHFHPLFIVHLGRMAVDPSIALALKLVFLWVLEFYQDLSFLQSQCCAWDHTFFNMPSAAGYSLLRVSDFGCLSAPLLFSASEF